MFRSLRPLGGLVLGALLVLSSPAMLAAQSRPYNPMRAATVRQSQAEVDEEVQPAPELAAPRPSVAPSWSPDRPKPMPVPPPRTVPAGRSWQTKQQMNAMPHTSVMRGAPAELPPPRAVGQPAPRPAPSPISNRQPMPEPLLAEGEGYDYEQVAPPAGDYAGEDQAWPDGAPYGHGYGGCGCQGCESCACGPQCGGGCCDGGCAQGCLGTLGFGKGLHFPTSLALFAGVEAFKSRVDAGQNGNFGFHEGVNLGGALFPGVNVGYQVGVHFTQTNLDGDTVNRVVGEDAIVRTDIDQRNQIFLTAGLFHRAVCMGWQGGVVWDMLHDDYTSNVDLHQVRGELSYVGPYRGELGVWAALNTKDDAAVSLAGNTVTWQPLDLYALFLRKSFGNCGQARLWGGFSGQGDGLFGGDLNVPLSCAWAMAASFNYLIPEGSSDSNSSQEGWNLGLSLVWYPGQTACACNCARPLFNVADNGTFMIDNR